MTYAATITSKRQLTIPADLFRKINLKQGQKVIITESNGIIKIESATDMINRLAGSLKIPDHLKKVPINRAIKLGTKRHFQEKNGLR